MDKRYWKYCGINGRNGIFTTIDRRASVYNEPRQSELGIISSTPLHYNDHILHAFPFGRMTHAQVPLEHVNPRSRHF